MSRLHRRLGAMALSVGLFPVALAAQGKFVNFETPVVKGLTIAQPSTGGTFAIVVNPDDDSISIFDAATAQPVVARQPVGSGPVRVVYDAANSRILTVNHIGDSVSIVDFPLAGGVLQTRLRRTFQVNDAPTDLVIDGATGTLWVLQSGTCDVGLYDDQGHTFGSALLWPRLFSDPSQPNEVMARAWRLAQRSDGRLLFLNQRGGSRLPTTVNNIAEAGFDLMQWTPPAGVNALVGASGLGSGSGIPTLGTSNMGMALATDGRLFVVGNDAQNKQDGESALKSMALGFVQSGLWVVDPSLAVVDQRDLNIGAGGGSTGVAAPSESVSMPTDVVLREQAGVVKTVYVPSFSTDRLVQLDLVGSQLSAAPRKIYNLQARSGYSMAGPRSLALAVAGGQEWLFVYDRLDASLRRFAVQSNGDLVTATGGPLAPVVVSLTDPFPIQHRFGQALLYDARLSQEGKASCASCHIDGRTDSLAWRLDTSGTTGTPPPLRPHMRDGVAADAPNLQDFPLDRQAMVTQTLQGLVAHPFDSLGVDLGPLLTTEPFYWRGKRERFEDFAGGFTDLLGAQQPSVADMQKYRDFVFTIMYPPNPEQARTRKYRGDLPSAPGGATQAVLGMMRYHEQSLASSGAGQVGAGSMTSGRSCVHCHRLPTGTNSRTTEAPNRGVVPSPFLPNTQPIKTAQLRGLRPREAFFIPPGNPGNPLSGLLPFGRPTNTAGLFHDGFAGSINHIIHAQFTPAGQTGDAVTQFVRELDTGVAPMVGKVGTYSAQTTSGERAVIDSLLTDMEAQARGGHSDIVVRRRIGGVQVDLFFNVLRDVYTDPLQPGSTTLAFTFAPTNTLIPATLANDDMVVVEAVPVGSGRRVASGQPSTLVHSAPALTSFRLVAADPWRDLDLLQLTGNVDLNNGANWTGPQAPAFPGPQDPLKNPPTVVAMQLFHTALTTIPGVNLNVASPQRHEPPRRLRVEGTGIELGAVVELWIPTQWGTVGTTPVVSQWRALILDLNPVRDNGNIVFETSATFDPMMTYALMCGWTGAPGVKEVMDRGGTSATLDPGTFNRFVVRVRNEGDNNGSARLDRLHL